VCLSFHLPPIIDGRVKKLCFLFAKFHFPQAIKSSSAVLGGKVAFWYSKQKCVVLKVLVVLNKNPNICSKAEFLFLVRTNKGFKTEQKLTNSFKNTLKVAPFKVQKVFFT